MGLSMLNSHNMSCTMHRLFSSIHVNSFLPLQPSKVLQAFMLYALLLLVRDSIPHPYPPLPPFSMCLSFLLPSSPILLSFLLLIALRLLPVEVHMIGVYMCMRVCVCMSEHSLHDYYDLVGIHLEFSRVITLNYSQQS